MEIFNYLHIMSNNDHSYDDNHDKKKMYSDILSPLGHKSSKIARFLTSNLSVVNIFWEQGNSFWVLILIRPGFAYV